MVIIIFKEGTEDAIIENSSIMEISEELRGEGARVDANRRERLK